MIYVSRNPPSSLDLTPAPFILFSVYDDLKSMYKKDEHAYIGRMAWNTESELKEVRIERSKNYLSSKKNRYCNVIVLKCTSTQIVRN